MSNYQAYILDYYENTLSPQQVAELLLFFEQHPELRHELEGYEPISLRELDHDVLSYDSKDHLKKNPVLTDELLIANVEGLLNSTEEESLQNMLKGNPLLQKELSLFQRTRLPEEHLACPDKNKLKKRTGLVRPLYYSLSAAASLLLLFALVINHERFEKPSPLAQAVVEPKQALLPQTAAIQEKPVVQTAADASPKISTKKLPPRVRSNDVPDAGQAALANEAIMPALASGPQQEALPTQPNTTRPDVPLIAYAEPLPVKVQVARTDDPDYPGLKTLLKGGLRKISGNRIEINTAEDANGDVVAYAVRAGDFEFSRSKGE